MKELKATIFKSRFHVTRFLGLLIMPFLYAFTFTLAFFDPFGHTQNIPMKVVTNKVGAKPEALQAGASADKIKAHAKAEDIYANQKFIDELGKEMAKPGTQIVTGGMTLDLNMEHIHVDIEPFKAPAVVTPGSPTPDETKALKAAKAAYKVKLDAKLLKIAEAGYTTFYVPQVEHVHSKPSLLSTLFKLVSGNHLTITKPLLIFDEMVKIMKDYHLGSAQVFANYKQSYLLGFSSDVSGAMSGKHNLVLSKLTGALLRLNKDVKEGGNKYPWFETMIKANLGANPPTGSVVAMATKAFTFLEGLQKSGIFTLHPVKVTSQMGMLGKNNHPTYGYGLGVFFIAVGMWIGAIVMTFAVHSKVHDKTVHPTKRYLIKSSIISLGIFIQSTILMTTLWFIGYSEIGIEHWFTLYMGVTISSMVFGVIVQAIRFTIPNRVFGIFMVIILLVLQIAASGGLFPYETQAGFYRGLHHILPMTYAINISREALFDTNWNNIFTNFGYLFIFLFTIPLGIVIKNRQDAAYYKKMDWQLPEVKGGKNV